MPPMQCCLRSQRYAVSPPGRTRQEYTGNFAIDEDVLRTEGVSDFEKYAVKPGSLLIADYFLPAERLRQFQLTIEDSKSLKRTASRQSIDKQISKQIHSQLSEDLVKKMGAVFTFHITGEEERYVTLNLKEGSGSVSDSKPAQKADVEFTCSGENYVKLFKGELSAIAAFSMQKLQIKGNIQKAIALESLMKKMQKAQK